VCVHSSAVPIPITYAFFSLGTCSVVCAAASWGLKCANAVLGFNLGTMRHRGVFFKLFCVLFHLLIRILGCHSFHVAVK
jgi:hypothetical protein